LVGREVKGFGFAVWAGGGLPQEVVDARAAQIVYGLDLAPVARGVAQHVQTVVAVGGRHDGAPAARGGGRADAAAQRVVKVCHDFAAGQAHFGQAVLGVPHERGRRARGGLRDEIAVGVVAVTGGAGAREPVERLVAVGRAEV